MARPRTYAGIARYSLRTLPKRVGLQRKRQKLSVREAAKQIGISHPTLLRIERGEEASTHTLVKVFAWLDGKDHVDGG